MAITDPIECNIEKFYEGDVEPGRSISECFFQKIGGNINGFAEAWKLDCKDFTGTGTWTSPDNVFGVFVIAHSMTSSFNLNQFAGEVISGSGRNGFSFVDNISPSTTYNYSTSGTLSVVCISC